MDHLVISSSVFLEGVILPLWSALYVFAIQLAGISPLTPLSIRGYPPKEKKKSKLSFSSKSHPRSGQPSWKSRPNWEQTLPFNLKEALEVCVTAVGKEVRIWTRTAWVCSTPAPSLTVGHARASLSLLFAPPSALGWQSVTSALQRGCQQRVQTWKTQKGLAHGWQSAKFLPTVLNPLKHLLPRVQWSSTMSLAGDSRTGWLCVQNKVFPMEKHSAFHEVPWSLQAYWNNTTITCVAKSCCQLSLRGPGIVSGTGKDSFTPQSIALNEQVALKPDE